MKNTIIKGIQDKLIGTKESEFEELEIRTFEVKLSRIGQLLHSCLDFLGKGIGKI